MTMTRRIAGMVLGSSLIAASCMGGWLHRAYSGELVDDHTTTKTKYIVSTAGDIEVQEWAYTPYGVVTYPGSSQPTQDWQNRWNISNIDDLRMVIKDLQKVEADMTAADCDESCSHDCDNVPPCPKKASPSKPCNR